MHLKMKIIGLTGIFLYPKKKRNWVDVNKKMKDCNKLGE